MVQSLVEFGQQMWLQPWAWDGESAVAYVWPRIVGGALCHLPNCWLSGFLIGRSRHTGLAVLRRREVVSERTWPTLRADMHIISGQGGMAPAWGSAGWMERCRC